MSRIYSSLLKVQLKFGSCNDISIKNKAFILQKIKQFEVRKGFLNCFVKFSHLETDFKEYDLLKHPINQNYLETVPKQTEPKGISSYAFKELQKLSQSMPLKYKLFCANLQS
jgi:hypothetical protein